MIWAEEGQMGRVILGALALALAAAVLLAGYGYGVDMTPPAAPTRLDVVLDGQ